MVFQYSYEGCHYQFEVTWTAPEGNSTVFLEIIDHLEKFHGSAFRACREQAHQLDLAVDKLYRQIFLFGNEYQAIPYDPKHRKRFLNAYGEIHIAFEKNFSSNGSAEMALVSELFRCVLDKLEEIVEVYLIDNSYQGKQRYRRKNFEEWAETTSEGSMFYEFESVLVQMTDISRLLEQLTETQRQRLVKHIFLNYTLQEIADEEGVSKQSVNESIAAALKKLRTLL